jgi:hypothetical protein
LGGPAQNGTNSSKELAWVEGLGQVVVRSDLQTQDSLDIFSTCSQNQHRNGRLRAQPAQNVQTPHARQHEIEDNKGMFSGESALKPTRSIVHSFDREPLGAKALREKSAQLDIIIDDENAIHPLPPVNLRLDTRPSLYRQKQPLQNFTSLNQSLSHAATSDAEIEMQYRRG